MKSEIDTLKNKNSELTLNLEKTQATILEREKEDATKIKVDVGISADVYPSVIVKDELDASEINTLEDNFTNDKQENGPTTKLSGFRSLDLNLSLSQSSARSPLHKMMSLKKKMSRADSLNSYAKKDVDNLYAENNQLVQDLNYLV